MHSFVFLRYQNGKRSIWVIIRGALELNHIFKKSAVTLAAAEHGDPFKSMGNYTLKTLMKPENEAEANVIKSILEEHGIYAEIKSFHDTAYDGLFQSQYGWGLIRVSETDLPEAQRIIEKWSNASPEELPWKNKSTD